MTMSNEPSFLKSDLLVLAAACLTLTALGCANSASLGGAGGNDGGADGGDEDGRGGNGPETPGVDVLTRDSPPAPRDAPDTSPATGCQYPTEPGVSDAGEELWWWYFNWTSASPSLAAMCAAWGADAKMILEVMVPASTTGTGTSLPICTSEAIATGSGPACSVADSRRFEAACTDGQFLFALPSQDTIDAYYHVESSNYPNSRRWTVMQAVEGCVRNILAIPGGPTQPASDGGVDLTLDGRTDSAPDGAGCGAGTLVHYAAPGCGGDAIPTCASVVDGGFSPSSYCACDGVTTLTYDARGVRSPYLYAGACKQDGGVDVVPPRADGGATEVQPTTDLALDDAADPCAACTADQVCVQAFDGTCHTGGAGCRTVSDACRTKLLASGAKSCAALSECQSELCWSPYQCVISSPCGTEAPQAAIYCYGP
jgi:hypothetical protein